jgi:pimeloyl-ACP methyl ester carboxylesterase
VIGDLGDGESPPVVLLHGSGGDAAMWDPLAPLLAPWMRVLTPRVPAEGNVADRAGAVRRELDVLGIGRAALVGHAEGAAIAELLAVEGRADALVLMDAAPLDPDDEAGLSGLEIPALVIWGEDDDVVDVANAERLGDLLPMAAVAVLPGCGHHVLADAPETVASLVFQWLRSRYLKMEHRHEGGPVVVELGRRFEGGRG